MKGSSCFHLFLLSFYFFLIPSFWERLRRWVWKRPCKRRVLRKGRSLWEVLSMRVRYVVNIVYSLLINLNQSSLMCLLINGRTHKRSIFGLFLKSVSTPVLSLRKMEKVIKTSELIFSTYNVVDCSKLYFQVRRLKSTAPKIRRLILLSLLATTLIWSLDANISME